MLRENIRRADKGIVVAILGGSGSGKDTVVAELLRRNPECIKVKSKTTRECRGGNDTENHEFVSFEDFERDVKTGKVLASTLYDRNYYWATTDQLNENVPVVFYIIDAAGLRELKEKYTDKPIVSVGLMIDPEIAEERMRKRGDSEEAIQRRLNNGDYFSCEVADWQVDASGSVKEVADEIETAIAINISFCPFE